MAVVEITNQAEIGRGYFGWQEFVLVESRIMKLVAERGEKTRCRLRLPVSILTGNHPIVWPATPGADRILEGFSKQPAS